MSLLPGGALAVLAMMFLLLLSPVAHAETRVVEVKGGTFVPSVLAIEAGDTLTGPLR